MYLDFFMNMSTGQTFEKHDNRSTSKSDVGICICVHKL